jgi:hypothetical protein
MKHTREILKKLESYYLNIDYYYAIIDVIEGNADLNPDISIESCKALLEGLSKFIWRQIDKSYDAATADKMDFQQIVWKFR